jgi:hypothetical protein
LLPACSNAEDAEGRVALRKWIGSAMAVISIAAFAPL